MWWGCECDGFGDKGRWYVVFWWLVVFYFVINDFLVMVFCGRRGWGFREIEEVELG